MNRRNVLTLIAVPLLGLWIGSAWIDLGYNWMDGAGRARHIGLSSGGLRVFAIAWQGVAAADSEWPRGFVFDRRPRRIEWFGHNHSAGRYIDWLLPLWLPVGLMTGAALVAWICWARVHANPVRWLRGRAGRCEACGYSLAGLPAGDGGEVVCPECGSAAPVPEE